MKSKLKIIIPIAISVIVIALAAVFISFKSQEITDVTALMDTARIALSDDKFEEAIAAFEKIINLDPNNADAYIGIAEVYEKIGDIDSAVYWLEKGEDMTGDERIIEYLARLKGESEELIVDSEIAAVTDNETASADNSENSSEEEELFLMEQEECISFYVPYQFSDENSKNSFNHIEYGDIQIFLNHDGRLLFQPNYTYGAPFIMSIDMNGSVSISGIGPDSTSLTMPQCNIYHGNGSAMAEYKDWYNKDGQLKKREFYYENELSSKKLYEYDDKGNIISINYNDQYTEDYQYDDEGRIIKGKYEVEYEYDSDGNIKQETYSSGGYSRYVYDSNGNVISDIYYNSYGEESIKNIYEYHPNNVISKHIYDDSLETEYNAEGIIIKYSDGLGNIHKYNEKGDKISFSYVRNDGTTSITEYSYKYDNYGRLTEITEPKYDGSLQITKYEYDNQGKLICETEIEGDYTYQEKHSYDSNGNRIKIEEYGDGILLHSHEVTEFIIIEVPKSVLEEAKKESHLFPQ